MDVLADITPLRNYLAPHRGRRRIVLVPTMGALHEGHAACVQTARTVDNRLVAVTIFVNPAQFGPSEDYSRYPRPLKRDLDVCRSWGVDAVFAPDGEATIYPEPQRVWVEVGQIAEPLCGRHRPGHFLGVATVVAKLFNIVLPDVAVFGQKDAQQALVIREMVRQLNMPVELLLTPTVREEDGLALSSRNAYMDAESRGRAGAIYAALRDAGERIVGGERDPRRIEAAVESRLRDHGIDEIDYVELRNAGDLSTLERIEGRVILAVAAHLGGARLIDNMVFDVRGDDVTVDTALF